MQWWLIVPAAAVGLVLLDRLLLWLESRGWIFYRKRKPKGGGGAMLGVAAELFQPAQHSAIRELDERSRRIELPSDAAPRDPREDPKR